MADTWEGLRLVAEEDGCTVKFGGGQTANAYAVCTNGVDWVPYTKNSVISLNSGDEVWFRCGSIRLSSQTISKSDRFTITGRVGAYGDVNSLLSAMSFIGLDMSAQSGLFEMAFYRLFYGCSSLTHAPELSSTRLAARCYHSMFMDCPALSEPPELPAEDLAAYCYNSMFRGCTALVNAPKLPALSLENSCYSSMFMGCTALVETPALNATALIDNCYNRMFSGCTSLVKAVLPAELLKYQCYSEMFNGCSALREVLINAYSWPEGGGSLTNWLLGVAPKGVLYRRNKNIKFSLGASGLPEGWVYGIYADAIQEVVMNIFNDLLTHAEYKTMRMTLAASQGDLSAGAILAEPSTPDGKVYLFDSTNTAMIGILLEDVSASTSAQSVEVIVSASVRREKLNAVKGGTALTDAQVLALRRIGIYCH